MGPGPGLVTGPNRDQTGTSTGTKQGPNEDYSSGSKMIGTGNGTNNREQKRLVTGPGLFQVLVLVPVPRRFLYRSQGIGGNGKNR